MMTSNNSKPQIEIAISNDHALVLYEWLSNSSFSHDPSLQEVMWKIEGILERQLPELLYPDYKNRVAEAKRRLSDET